MATLDVTVMGAGIFGLSVAYVCVKRGASVRTVEPYGIGAGSSGGIVGALAPHTPENWNEKKEFQFQSLMMAEGFWRSVDALSGLNAGYARLGRLQAIANHRGLELAHAREKSAAELWRGKANWRVVPADTQECSPVTATDRVIKDSLSARLHPRHACESLAWAFRALGGEVVIGRAKPEGQVIWATGVQGLNEISEGRSRPVGNGVKGQALLLDFDMGSSPQIFAEGVHVIPHFDGTTAIGSTSERDYVSPDGTDAQLDVLLAKALQLCPFLCGSNVLENWAGVRPRARSRAPMLGAWPGRPGHFIANGGFKIGFGMAPKSAEVMADLVLEGVAEIPDGFQVAASF